MTLEISGYTTIHRDRSRLLLWIPHHQFLFVDMFVRLGGSPTEPVNLQAMYNHSQSRSKGPLESKSILLEHPALVRAMWILRPGRRHIEQTDIALLGMIRRDIVPVLPEDLVGRGVSGPPDAEHLRVRVGTAGSKKGAEDVVEELRVEKVGGIVVGVYVAGLAVEGAPDGEHVGGVAGGVVVGVWGTDGGDAGVGLDVAVGDFEFVEGGEGGGAAVGEEVGLWAGPLAVG